MVGPPAPESTIRCHRLPEMELLFLSLLLLALSIGKYNNFNHNRFYALVCAKAGRKQILKRKCIPNLQRTKPGHSSGLSISNRQLATTSLVLKMADSNVPRFATKHSSAHLRPIQVATLQDTRLPSAPKKCLNAVWKDALSAILTMHLASASVLKNCKQITKAIFQVIKKGKK